MDAVQEPPAKRLPPFTDPAFARAMSAKGHAIQAAARHLQAASDAADLPPDPFRRCQTLELREDIRRARESYRTAQAAGDTAGMADAAKVLRSLYITHREVAGVPLPGTLKPETAKNTEPGLAERLARKAKGVPIIGDTEKA